MEAAGLGDQFLSLQLPVSPRAAIELTESIVLAQVAPVVLIGSSLGGYYAIWLTEHYPELIKYAVLVNPSVAAAGVEELLGTHVNFHSGETFEFTIAHVDEIRMLEMPLIRHQNRYWLLVETGDEVLDYRLAVAKLLGARQTVLAGGDHSFTRWTDYLDEIVALN